MDTFFKELLTASPQRRAAEFAEQN
jgi:hypothetical protein